MWVLNFDINSYYGINLDEHAKEISSHCFNYGSIIGNMAPPYSLIKLLGYGYIYTYIYIQDISKNFESEKGSRDCNKK